MSQQAGDNLSEGLSATQKKPETYYDTAMRWIEDTYLNWFGENRTSYGVKDTLHKTEITGNKDIDGIQHSVNEAVGNTVGQNGLAGGVGNLLDKNVMKGRTG